MYFERELVDMCMSLWICMVQKCILCYSERFIDVILIFCIRNYFIENTSAVFFRLNYSITKVTVLESREYGCRDPSSGTLYSQKLALTSPTSGGHSASIVRSRTQATDLSLI
jgi:hypothetical protein